MKTTNLAAITVAVITITFLGLVGLSTFASSGYTILKTSAYAVVVENGLSDIQNLSKFSAAFEKSFSANIVGRSSWLDLNGFVWKVEGRKIVDDGLIVKDTEGKLHRLNPLIIDVSTTNAIVESVIIARDLCAQQNVPLVFVQAPEKIQPGRTILPPGLVDLSNTNADTLLAALVRSDVLTYDLRMVIFDEYPYRNQSFYITDHHWTAPAAFWAAGSVAEFLNAYLPKQKAIQVPPASAMLSRTWPHRFLGSQGVRTGRYYSGIDDMVVPYPVEMMDFSLELIQKETPSFLRRGDFLDALIDVELLNGKYVNAYNAFLFGASVEAKLLNYSRPDGPRVLLIADSFGRAFAPYLSLGCSELVYLDPQQNRFTDSLYGYIELFTPDVVIVMFTAAIPGIPLNMDKGS